MRCRPPPLSVGSGKGKIILASSGGAKFPRGSFMKTAHHNAIAFIIFRTGTGNTRSDLNVNATRATAGATALLLPAHTHVHEVKQAPRGSWVGSICHLSL